MGGIFVGLFAEGLNESEFCGFELNRTQQRLKQIILEMIILYLKDLLLDRIYRIQAINFESAQTLSSLSDELTKIQSLCQSMVVSTLWLWMIAIKSPLGILMTAKKI